MWVGGLDLSWTRLPTPGTSTLGICGICLKPLNCMHLASSSTNFFFVSFFVNVNVKVPDTRAGWLLHWADYFSPPKVKSTILKRYYDMFANVESGSLTYTYCVIWIYSGPFISLVDTKILMIPFSRTGESSMWEAEELPKHVERARRLGYEEVQSG